MWATVSLTATVTNPDQLRVASTAASKAISAMSEHAATDCSFSIHHLDPDSADEPDYEKLYHELFADVNALATEWEESDTKYKQKLADELRLRTRIVS